MAYYAKYKVVYGYVLSIECLLSADFGWESEDTPVSTLFNHYTETLKFSLQTSHGDKSSEVTDTLHNLFLLLKDIKVQQTTVIGSYKRNMPPGSTDIKFIQTLVVSL